MDNPRPEKVAVVEEVRERLDSTSAALLTEYRGLDVTAISDLRRALRQVGGEYKIYKNTLVRFAARDLGFRDRYFDAEGDRVPADAVIVVNLSGRGDKDVNSVQQILAMGMGYGENLSVLAPRCTALRGTTSDQRLAAIDEDRADCDD